MTTTATTSVQRLFIKGMTDEEQIALAYQTVLHNVLMGNFGDACTQLSDIGPYAVPMILDLGSVLNQRQRAALRRHLMFVLDMQLPRRNFKRALTEIACLYPRALE